MGGKDPEMLFKNTSGEVVKVCVLSHDNATSYSIQLLLELGTPML